MPSSLTAETGLLTWEEKLGDWTFESIVQGKEDSSLSNNLGVNGLQIDLLISTEEDQQLERLAALWGDRFTSDPPNRLRHKYIPA